MFHEDVLVESHETLSRLAVVYAHKPTDWVKIWNAPRNAALVARRKVPEQLQFGDILYVPIPWKVVSRQLTKMGDGGQLELQRDGETGERVTWVQTVYRHNQAIGPNPSPFCVDGCTPDDNLPYYWTNAEVAADATRRKTFRDHSSRNPPTAAKGTTKWRAVVSLAVVTKQRVTIWDSLVWGWDMTPANVISTVGPRAATAYEIQGHLNMLGKGVGTGPLTFGKSGWTFRSAPP